MNKSHSLTAMQFEDAVQQHEVSSLGMWVFLATEVLFFGGMFLAYLVYRSTYPAIFAEASHFQNIALGGINTGVLLCSSLTMALAVHSIQTGNRRRTILFLIVTMILGVVFLGIKGVEYTAKYEEHLVPGINFAYGGANPGIAEIYFVL